MLLSCNLIKLFPGAGEHRDSETRVAQSFNPGMKDHAGLRARNSNKDVGPPSDANESLHRILQFPGPASSTGLNWKPQQSRRARVSTPIRFSKVNETIPARCISM